MISGSNRKRMTLLVINATAVTEKTNLMDVFIFKPAAAAVKVTVTL